MEMNNNLDENQNTTSFKINGDWDRQSSALRTKYPRLSSDDVKFEPGKETELFKKIETRIGKDRNQLLIILDNNHKDVMEMV